MEVEPSSGMGFVKERSFFLSIYLSFLLSFLISLFRSFVLSFFLSFFVKTHHLQVLFLLYWVM